MNPVADGPIVSSNLACKPLATHLSGTVKEVILDISRNGVYAILEHALLRAHPSSSKVCLQRSSTAIGFRNGIRMIGPYCT